MKHILFCFLLIWEALAPHEAGPIMKIKVLNAQTGKPSGVLLLQLKGVGGVLADSTGLFNLDLDFFDVDTMCITVSPISINDTTICLLNPRNDTSITIYLVDKRKPLQIGEKKKRKCRLFRKRRRRYDDLEF